MVPKFSLCLLLVLVQLTGILSAPVGDGSLLADRRSVATRQNSTDNPDPELEDDATSATTLSPILSDQGNFIDNEEDLEEFLKKSREEFEQSIRLNPANYASGNLSTEEIMALFGKDQTEAATVAVEIATEPDLCPICLDELADRPVHRTRCGHEFHADCLGECIGSARSIMCPICRRHIDAHYDPFVGALY